MLHHSRAAHFYPLGEDFLKHPGCMVRPTGEFRCPRAGEWYLSGAFPVGYRARADLNSKYHIVRVCRVRRVTYIEEIDKDGNALYRCVE